MRRRIRTSTDHRFVYIRIPKAANSTVMTTLAAYDPSFSGSSVSAADAKKLVYPEVPLLDLAMSRVLHAAAFRFTVVRNPYSRLLSAFLDKVRGSQGSARTFFAWGGRPESDLATFVSFLEQGNLLANPHWAPQVTFVPTLRLVDFVGRVESLEKDLERIVRQIWPASSYSGTHDYRPHATGAEHRCASEYDDDLMGRVFRLYRQDFELFGYGRDTFSWHG